MTKLKLTYFDFNGGRGEVARLALNIAGVPFEDVRVPQKDWPSFRAKTPFSSMPLLEVDGVLLTQSNAINRYVGKLTRLYPEDALQAAFCDEAMDVVEDITMKVTTTFSIKDEEEKKRKRVELADGPISLFLRGLEGRLSAHGGEWFAGNHLTVADLKVYLWIRHLKSGNLDYIPADLPDKVAPQLVQHFERVKNLPGVKAYYANRSIP
jgi:glutathione S-transferase